MYTHRTLLLLVMLFAANFSFAQGPFSNTSASVNNSTNDMLAYGYRPTETIKKPKKSYRFHKRLSGTFSGYVIELVTSNLPLERSYPLFRQFGNVYYDKLDEGGYSYVIKTDFESKAALEKFYTSVILPKDSKAKMVSYKLGKRNIL